LSPFDTDNACIKITDVRIEIADVVLHDRETQRIAHVV
jgi:hypothetical protein